MVKLLIETSTESSVIAFIEKKNIVFSKEFPLGNRSSQFLLPYLQKGIETLGLSLSLVEAIGVGVGPGSFTGIRVGVTVAKTLSFVHKIPLVGINSLESFSCEEEGPFAVVFDGRRAGAYLFIGERKNGRFRTIHSPGFVTWDEFPYVIGDVSLLVTPHKARMEEYWQKKLGNSLWRWLECYPSISRMGQLLEEKLLKNLYTINGEVDLCYFRKTQAEVEKEKNRLFFRDSD